MAPVREVAFELECFEWADERLEVAGRWKGLGPRRLSRPVLTVETEGGRRKRIVALARRADGVGRRDVARDVLLAGRSRRDHRRRARGRRQPRRRPAAAGPQAPPAPPRRPSRAPTRRCAPRSARCAARSSGCGRELAGREREIIALRSELDEETDDDAGVERAGADQRTVEIQRLAGELERMRDEQAAVADERTVEVQQLARERDEARAELSADAERREAEQSRWQEEIDALREAFSDAAAEAEASRDRHRAELGELQDALRAERAEVARLTTQLAAAEEDAAPGRPRRGAQGRRGRRRPGDAADAGACRDRRRHVRARGGRRAAHRGDARARGPSTGGRGDPTEVEAAVLDAPGPLLAGGRPVTPPGAEEQPRVSRVPAWLRGGEDADEAPPGDSPLQALRERFAGMFASNGHADEAGRGASEPAVPRPRRSAAAARARAEATVAARRSPAEVWGMRVLAAIVVAVLLITFVAGRHLHCVTLRDAGSGSSSSPASRSPRCRCCSRGRSRSTRGRGSRGVATSRGSS